MKINFAVDRLYTTGWLPADGMDLERLPNGLRYPTVVAIKKEFVAAGLELTIKPNSMFHCCRAEWGIADANSINGTVIGSCESEAAVYALAKLREQQRELVSI